MDFNFDIIKKHPVAATAAILGGGVALYLLMSSGSSSASSTATTSDPNAAAELQYAEQQLQTQGQLAVTQSNNDTAVAIANIQGGTQNNAISAQITENAQTAATQQHAIDAQVAQTQIATTAQIDAINADLAKAQSADAVTSHVADVTAAEQTGIATINAQLGEVLAQINGTVQSNISANQTQVAITQANDSLAGVQAQVGATKAASSNNLFGGIIGGGLSLLSNLL